MLREVALWPSRALIAVLPSAARVTDPEAMLRSQIWATCAGKGSGPDPGPLLASLSPLQWFVAGTASGLSSTLGRAARTVDAACGLVLRLRALPSHASECLRGLFGDGALSALPALGLFSILGSSFRPPHVVG